MKLIFNTLSHLFHQGNKYSISSLPINYVAYIGTSWTLILYSFKTNLWFDVCAFFQQNYTRRSVCIRVVAIAYLRLDSTGVGVERGNVDLWNAYWIGFRCQTKRLFVSFLCAPLGVFRHLLRLLILAVCIIQSNASKWCIYRPHGF